MKSEPHRCEPCIRDGGYNGILRFPNDPIPVCRIHDQPMTPVEKKK